MRQITDTRKSTEIVQACIQAVCQVFDLTEREILSDGRSRRIAWPRQLAMAMAMARARSGLALQSLSGHFKRKDHGTVMHAVQMVFDQLEVSEVNEAFDSIVNNETSDICVSSTG